MQTIYIIVTTTLWFVIYGIINNQITIRICKEYFTVYHQKISNTNDLTLIALIWGILATWWLGILIGLAIAFFARFGSKNKVNLNKLLYPAILCTIITFISSAFSGLVGFYIAKNRIILVSYWFNNIPYSVEEEFMATLLWHNVGYFCGFSACLCICIWIFKQRLYPQLQAER